jgi:hypothetical protein
MTDLCRREFFVPTVPVSAACNFGKQHPVTVRAPDRRINRRESVSQDAVFAGELVSIENTLRQIRKRKTEQELVAQDFNRCVFLCRVKSFARNHQSLAYRAAERGQVQYCSALRLHRVPVDSDSHGPRTDEAYVRNDLPLYVGLGIAGRAGTVH